MPYYCFSTDDGHVEEIFFRMADVPSSVELLDGRIAKRDFSLEHLPRRAGSGWPMECIASGVAPQQAGELRELFQKVGVSTEVSTDGNPIYTSAAHRKRALKARGFFDRNSF